jgi:hypothetical protein
VPFSLTQANERASWNEGLPHGNNGLLTQPSYPLSVSYTSSYLSLPLPAYCSTANQNKTYANAISTSGLPLGYCVEAFGGQFTDADCTVGDASLPIWAWVLIELAIAFILGMIGRCIYTRWCQQPPPSLGANKEYKEEKPEEEPSCTL